MSTSRPTELEFTPVPHPDPVIRRVGFDLDHPYIEQCWMAVVGPTAVALLRRLPAMWAQGTPVTVTFDELSLSLGLGASVGSRSRFARNLDRLTQFDFARWTEPGRALAVHTEVRPVPDRLRQSVPLWVSDAHDRLIDEQLAQLNRTAVRAPQAAAATARLDRSARRDPVAAGSLSL